MVTRSDIAYILHNDLISLTEMVELTGLTYQYIMKDKNKFKRERIGRESYYHKPTPKKEKTKVYNRFYLARHNLLKEYLSGKTVTQLSLEYNISKQAISAKIIKAKKEAKQQ